MSEREKQSAPLNERRRKKSLQQKNKWPEREKLDKQQHIIVQSNMEGGRCIEISKKEEELSFGDTVCGKQK